MDDYAHRHAPTHATAPAPETGLVWRLRRLVRKAHDALEGLSRGPHEEPIVHYHAGEAVCVRSAVEILATLDMNGRLDGLPFMPEMAVLIGRSVRIRRVACRNRAEGGGLASLKDTVFIEDGPDDAHSHVHSMYWKEAWLAPVSEQAHPTFDAERAARRSLLELAARNRRDAVPVGRHYGGR